MTVPSLCAGARQVTERLDATVAITGARAPKRQRMPLAGLATPVMVTAVPPMTSPLPG